MTKYSDRYWEQKKFEADQFLKSNPTADYRKLCKKIKGYQRVLDKFHEGKMSIHKECMGIPCETRTIYSYEEWQRNKEELLNYARRNLGASKEEIMVMYKSGFKKFYGNSLKKLRGDMGLTAEEIKNIIRVLHVENKLELQNIMKPLRLEDENKHLYEPLWPDMFSPKNPQELYSQKETERIFLETASQIPLREAIAVIRHSWCGDSYKETGEFISSKRWLNKTVSRGRVEQLHKRGLKKLYYKLEMKGIINPL